MSQPHKSQGAAHARQQGEPPNPYVRKEGFRTLQEQKAARANEGKQKRGEPRRGRRRWVQAAIVQGLVFTLSGKGVLLGFELRNNMLWVTFQ